MPLEPLEVARIAVALAREIDRGVSQHGLEYFGNSEEEFERTELIQNTCPDPAAVLEENHVGYKSWEWFRKLLGELTEPFFQEEVNHD